MIRTVLLIASAAALAVPVFASSDDAWAEHEKTVTAACIAASGFNDAKAHTNLILFDDNVGMDALVIEGAYPQEHMKGEHGMVLCLYDKKAEKAVVSEMTHK